MLAFYVWMFQGNFKSVSRMFQGNFNGVSGSFKGVASKIEWCLSNFKGVQWYLKGVKFQEWCKQISRVFQKDFKGVSRKF